MRDGTKTFPVDRGALRGDRLSPVLFVVVLAVILEDGCGSGVATTGFAEDLCLAATDANASWAQTAPLADKSADFVDVAVDVAVDVPKTEATHVREDEHEHASVAEAEAAAVTSTHEHACEHCSGRAST